MLDAVMLSFEQELATLVRESGVSSSSSAALEHAVFPAGKRIRPRLLFSIAIDLFATVVPRVLSSGCAVELLHCASLIHDDLPALDNDLVRRGRPTVHALFGAGVATLAGDLAAALPFTINGVDRAALARAYIKLCDGQVLDLAGAKTAGELKGIHALKTGALFRLCGELAFDAPSSSPAVHADVCSLCEALGVEFQLQNDLRDALDTRGGELPSDARNKKLSESVIEELPQLLSEIRIERERLLERLSSAYGLSLVHTRALIRSILS